MQFKKATYIVNALFILLAGAFLVMITMFPDSVIKLTIGPGYYPAIVCFLLIGAAAISMFKTYRYDEDRRIELPKLHNAAIVIGVAALFLVLWELTGMFYVVSFIAIAALLFFLNPQPDRKARLIKAACLSLGIQGFIYGVFQKLMHFNF